MFTAVVPTEICPNYSKSIWHMIQHCQRLPDGARLQFSVLYETDFSRFTCFSPREVPESVGLLSNKHLQVQVILCCQLLIKQKGCSLQNFFFDRGHPIVLILTNSILCFSSDTTCL